MIVPRKLPNLRFPSFSRDWTIKKVGSIVKRISIPVDVKAEELYKQIGIRSHGKGIFYKEPVKGKTIGNKRVFWVKENALIVNIVFAWEQAIAKTTEKEIGMIASHRFPMYSPLDNQANLDYLLQFFLTPTGKALLGLASPGGAGRNKTLGQKEFENLKILIPEVNEQKLIASFLTLIDNRITLLRKKITLLEDYKKGIIQRIFSREVRFFDNNGVDFPKWEKKKFGEVYCFKPTYSFSRENLNYTAGEVKYIHYGDIHTKFQVHFDITREQVPYLNPGILKIKSSANTYCKEGDLVIADASENYEDVGKSIELVNLNQENIIPGLHTFLARPNLSLMSIGFGGFLMKSPAIRKQIKILAQGSKVLSISSSRLANINLEIPSKPEQARITIFLSFIEDKLVHSINQLAKIEQLKKGLIQKVFC